MHLNGMETICAEFLICEIKLEITKDSAWLKKRRKIGNIMSIVNYFFLKLLVFFTVSFFSYFNSEIMAVFISCISLNAI